jgi:hypothetical protein
MFKLPVRLFPVAVFPFVLVLGALAPTAPAASGRATGDGPRPA